LWWADLWAVHSAGRDMAAPALSLGTSSALRRVTSPPLRRARAAQAGTVLRLDIHPTDFDHVRHVAAIERVLAVAADRAALTYDELASGRILTVRGAARTAAARYRPTPDRPKAAAARRIRRQ
jgi:hypothetical protein